MKIMAYLLSGLSFVMSFFLLFKLKFPRAVFILPFKLTASALSPLWAVFGAVGAAIGWATQAVWAVPTGIISAGMMTWYVWRCARRHDGFERAFGAGWPERILPEQAQRMVQKRWSPYLKMKTYPAPAFERDIPFYEVPGTDRQVLCDVWSPADGDVSGLGYIYFHGSGWFTLDKDFGTRPFFNHLAAQGHTVMDVAYRLCPEVDIFDMVGDVKQAIAWMKRNASRYGVDPNKIVLGGGSAGCHLALLAAYAPQQPEFTPQELEDVDLSACGVISYYGPSDLRAGYERYTTKMIENRPAVPIGTKMDPVEGRDYAGRLDILLGCHPQESPEVYELASPINHVHPGCPPTLLIQGEQDMLVSPDETRALYTKLVEAGVPSVYVNFPFTEHAFDLLLPQVSPPAQSALYDVDRFLALLLNKD